MSSRSTTGAPAAASPRSDCADWLRDAALAGAMRRWLPQRRWYAGKERSIREVTVDDVVPLGAEVALVIVGVAFAEGDDHRYAVPLMRATGRVAASLLDSNPGAVVAELDDDARLVDAIAAPEGAAVVVRAALEHRTHRGRQGSACGAPRRAGLARRVGGAADVQLLGVEQSNSSVIVGDDLIAKLVRRIEPGPNPDVTLPAHLTARGFTHVPGVAATLDLVLAGDERSIDLVIVHDAIHNEGDLWAWTLGELSRSIERHGELDGETRSVADLLGRRTGQLHAALADTHGDDDMAPLPSTLAWQRSLLQTLRDGLRATQRSLRRAGLTDRAVLAPVDEVLRRFEPLRSRKLDARRIRVHGDLHLGQVLWTGNDVVFIDFEGEPGRPIGERMIKRSPLTDVAGLIRSIDYAARSAIDTAVARGVVAPDDRAVDHSREAWVRGMRDTLVASYLAEIAGASLVPADPVDTDLLLRAYLLQKGLYEIRYELANRPDWVHWPLSAVSEMIST